MVPKGEGNGTVSILRVPTASFRLQSVSGHNMRLVSGSPTVFGPPDSLQLSGQALQHLTTEGSLSWNVADEEHGCQRGRLCFCGSFARGLELRSVTSPQVYLVSSCLPCQS